MPVPSTIDDLSTTASSNSPAGSETPTEGDNYIRTLSSFIALLRDKLDGTSDTGTVKNAAFSGTQTGATTWSDLQTFSSGINVGGTTFTSLPTSGTYTPTISSVLNVASTTARTCSYTRVGNIVTVGLAVTVTPTASGPTQTTFRVSLPVSSTLSSAYQLSGSCYSNFQRETGARIYADTGTSTAEVIFYANSTIGHDFQGVFMYLVA